VQVAHTTQDESAKVQVLLDLLAAKGSVKRAEVAAAVAEAKLDMAEAQCGKALKEICQSKGALWSLKESNFRS